MKALSRIRKTNFETCMPRLGSGGGKVKKPREFAIREGGGGGGGVGGGGGGKTKKVIKTTITQFKKKTYCEERGSQEFTSQMGQIWIAIPFNKKK